MKLDDALGLVDAGHDGDDHEDDREADRELEEGLLHPTPRPVDRIAPAAEGAAEALPPQLEQQRDDQRDREDGLDNEQDIQHSRELLCASMRRMESPSPRPPVNNGPSIAYAAVGCDG